MKLTTIADLQTQDLKPVLEVIKGLGSHYVRFIETDLQGYRYEVSAGPESSRKPGIHASEVSGCARRLVYGIGTTERRPDPNTTDANMRMRFRLGTAVHHSIQDDFVRMCAVPYNAPDGSTYTLTFEPETRIDPSLGGVAEEFNVQSSTDGIFTFWQNDQPVIRILLEIKTASKDEFDKIKDPKIEHVEQGHVYMGCLDIPMIWYLYYNKSNSNFTHPMPPFLLRFNDKLWHEMEVRFAHSLYMNDVSQLPDRTESMACRWCPFSYTCKPAILSRTNIKVSSATASRRLGKP